MLLLKRFATAEYDYHDESPDGRDIYDIGGAIGIGAVTSALIIGMTMLALNSAGVHYTTKGIPDRQIEVPADAPREKVGRPYEGKDSNEYRVVHIVAHQFPDVNPGRYLVDDQGHIKYRTDLPINRQEEQMDDGETAPAKFAAPQPQLFQLIIEGILSGELEWSLVIAGALIAITLELAGVSALPVAVGMYLPLGTTTPIFVGGALRWVAERFQGKPASEAETETSPAVLLSSGYIAGGTLIGLIVNFFVFLPKQFNDTLAIGQHLGDYAKKGAEGPKIVALAMFAVLAAVLLKVGLQKSPEVEEESQEIQ